MSAFFKLPKTSDEAINPHLDPAREDRIKRYTANVELGLEPCTGKAPPEMRSAHDVLQQMIGKDRLAAMPCLDDLEDEFDDDIEACTTKNLMKCEHYSVDALDLSIRARRSLQDFGIATIGELCAYTQAELKKAFGTLSVSEILDRLRDHGIVLAPS